jgi:hypothetical protein
VLSHVALEGEYSDNSHDPTSFRFASDAAELFASDRATAPKALLGSLLPAQTRIRSACGLISQRVRVDLDARAG